MKTLAKRIKRELERETPQIARCVVYEDELQRLWPIDEEDRKQKIAHFANANGFKLSFYKQGLCAILRESHPAIQQGGTSDRSPPPLNGQYNRIRDSHRIGLRDIEMPRVPVGA